MPWKASYSGPRIVKGGHVAFYLDGYSPYAEAPSGSPPVGSPLLLELKGKVLKCDILKSSETARTIKVIDGDAWELEPAATRRFFKLKGSFEEWRVVRKAVVSAP